MDRFFNCLPLFLNFPTFSWQEFWHHYKKNNILKCFELIGRNFVPQNTFNICKYYTHIERTTTELVRKLCWKIVIADDKEFVKPPWGYISSNKWPGNEHQQLVDKFKSLATITSVEHSFETAQKVLNKYKHFHFQLKLSHFKNLLKTDDELIPVPADKNMGWFWISKLQMQNIKNRERARYLPVNTDVDTIWSDLLNGAIHMLELAGCSDAVQYIERWINKHPLVSQSQVIPKLYFLVKVGKLIDKGEYIDDNTKDLTHLPAELPYRPILPFSACKLFPLCEVVAAVFNSILPLYEWILIDTKQFVSWWHNTKNQGTPITTDATNLYGCIPPADAVNIMSLLIERQEVKTHLELKFPKLYNRFVGVGQARRRLLIVLLDICLSNTFLKIDGIIYKQHNGLPMGNPAVPPIANLFLVYYEINNINKNLFRRYLDDICARYAFNMNIYPPYIQLNLDDKPTKFLDVKFSDNEDTEVNIKQFAAKPPHFSSNVPMSLKKSYFVSQLHRANTICSTENAMFDFRTWLFKNARIRGYPFDLARDLSFQPVLPSKNKNRNNKDNFFMVQRIPSIGAPNIATKLRQTLSTHIPDEYKIIRARQYDTNIDKLLRAQMWKKGY